MSDSALTRLPALVERWQPLFESLIPGGQDFHYAAIWGQVPQESRTNAAAEEFPNQPTKGGKGLWEHTGPRLKNNVESPGNPLGLYEFARRAGKPWQDEETQVRFVAYEIHNLPAAEHAWRQTLKTGDVGSATGTFMAYFEGPAGWQQELQNPGSTTANLPRRIAGAKVALDKIRSLKGAGAKKMDDLNLGTQKTPADKVAEIHEKLPLIEKRLEEIGLQLAKRYAPGPVATGVQLLEVALGFVLPTVNAKFETRIASSDAAAFILKLADFAAAKFFPGPAGDTGGSGGTLIDGKVAG